LSLRIGPSVANTGDDVAVDDAMDETGTTDSGSVPAGEDVGGATDVGIDGSPEPENSAAEPPGRDAVGEADAGQEPSPEPAGAGSNRPAGSLGPGCGVMGMVPWMLFGLGWGAVRWTRK
jgi:hypothetical protein